MDVMHMEEVVRNIDHRLEKVEQFLPLLATKDELREALAPLATKAELRATIAEAIAPLATKAELRASVAEAIAPLATKEQLEDNRCHAQVLFESLQDSIRMVADGVLHLTTEVREMKAIRLLALEKGRPPRRRR